MIGQCCENYDSQCRLTFDKVDGVLQVFGNIAEILAFEEVCVILKNDTEGELETQVMKEYPYEKFCYYTIATKMSSKIAHKYRDPIHLNYREAIVNLLYWLYGEPHKKDNKLRLMLLEKDDTESLINSFNKENNSKVTQKKILANRRIGQEVFKKRLSKIYHKCLLCDMSDVRYLVASHIKPWSKSDDVEKLDFYNGFLLCPSHDAAFDEIGNILVSNFIDEKTINSLNLKEDMKIDLFEENKKYLEFHRSYIFTNI